MTARVSRSHPFLLPQLVTRSIPRGYASTRAAHSVRPCQAPSLATVTAPAAMLPPAAGAENR